MSIFLEESMDQPLVQHLEKFHENKRMIKYWIRHIHKIAGKKKKLLAILYDIGSIGGIG